MRHHVVLGEALSMETLRKGGHRNSLLGPAHWIVFYNHSGQVWGSGSKETLAWAPIPEDPFPLECPQL